MLTLVNTNRMVPPIAPVGLDYVAATVRDAGFDVELIDLCLADDPKTYLADYFRRRRPSLVGLSFRNVDDCFWPSGQSFVETLIDDVRTIRGLTDAPIVLGGVGFSLFPRRLLELTGAEFGVHGDGELAVVELLRQIHGRRRWERVPGLLYRAGGTIHANPPAWPKTVSVPGHRELVDNELYFRRGGQIGVETKRGCARGCIYCADPLTKGRAFRLRPPSDVVEEVQRLVERGIDVLHLCDPEFNLPLAHAKAICDELIRRGIGRRVRWYAYLAVVPFSVELARQMRRAGCVGIDFTADSAHPALLAAYGHAHTAEDIDKAVRACRENQIAVMLDMLLGGPGESPKTVEHTIRAFQRIGPDCAGAALGVRLYPGTAVAETARREGRCSANIRRLYHGPTDLLRPTFYLSAALGDRPAALVRELIGTDERFFPPEDPQIGPAEAGGASHNYNQNKRLLDAIEVGARGAYWDILRRLPRT
ncbi:MAG: radical SAM protein [Planctomycetes bacterium]|nr:radical SAM protein [Planctomycetota bacterium]